MVYVHKPYRIDSYMRILTSRSVEDIHALSYNAKVLYETSLKQDEVQMQNVFTAAMPWRVKRVEKNNYTGEQK